MDRGLLTATQTEPRPVNLDRVPHDPPPGLPAWTGHPQPSQTPAYQLTGNYDATSLTGHDEVTCQNMNVMTRYNFVF